jgi:hypothetical protein
MEQKEEKGMLNKINLFPIICPECQKKCLLEMKDFKINLSDCPNGHSTKNLLLDKFISIQKKDIKEIGCDVCQENVQENQCYICNTCDVDLCSKCRLEHNKFHKIINYEDKIYICKKHDRTFDSFCKKCKENICSSCYPKHIDHKSEIIYLGLILQTKDDLKNKSINHTNIINNFKNGIEDIISKLNKIIEYTDILINLEENFINNFNDQNYNYEILSNLNQLTSDKIFNSFEKINTDKNIIHKFKNIMMIYEKMTNINLDIEKYYYIIKNSNHGLSINSNISEIKQNNLSNYLTSHSDNSFSFKNNKDKIIKMLYKRKDKIKESEKNNLNTKKYLYESKVNNSQTMFEEYSSDLIFSCPNKMLGINNYCSSNEE